MLSIDAMSTVVRSAMDVYYGSGGWGGIGIILIADHGLRCYTNIPEINLLSTAISAERDFKEIEGR